MSRSTRSAPKSGKFSHLRNIRADYNGGGPAAAPATEEPAFGDTAKSTLQVLDRHHDKIAFDEDCDEKIRRHRYVQTVLHMLNQASQYHSVGLFVEAMLRELDTRESVDVASRAAVATWALNLLSAQSPNGALDAIASAIMPAIYCQYNPSLLDRPSAAIRAQVRDAKVIVGNPYFTHAMYVEQVTVDRNAIDDLTVSLHRAIEANDTRRNFVMRRISAGSNHSLQTAFRAWRAQARRARILVTTSENRGRRQDAAARRLRMQAAFYQWKASLESSRNAFLMERLHEAATQLDSAKNQFQLQCYRADRLIQSGKETKEELARTVEINEDLHRRVATLKKDLVDRERDYNEKLVSHVAAALNLVQSYAHVVITLASARMKPEPYQVQRDESEHSDGTSEVAEAAGSRPLTQSGSLRKAGDAVNTEETVDGTSAPVGGTSSLKLGATTAFSSATRTSSTGAGAAGAVDGTDADEEAVLNVLRRWCNAVLREVQGVHFKPVFVFGSDFATGEAYLVLLNHVFPDTASLMPNLEPNMEYRLRRIRDMSEKSRLVHVLEPEDFLERREDRIVRSLCELYTRHLDNKWRANAVTAAIAFSEELRGETGEEEVAVTDDASFRSFVNESRERLAALKKELMDQCLHEEDLVLTKQRVKAEEAHLAEEERKGLPLLLVGDISTRPFWDLKRSALEDLRTPEMVGNDTELWAQLMTGPFPEMLKECVSLTSRLFCFYAGGNVRSMTEFTFWRFVEMQSIGSSSGPSKATIARVLDRVASPQLANAIKAAAYGRSDMDAQTLMNVARQELDIRHISGAQFVEILVRLGIEQNGRTMGLIRGVRSFLRDIALPRKSLLAPVQTALYESDSQYIIRFFCDDLARAFFFYLRRQESSKAVRERQMATQDGGRFAGLMSVATFTRMLDDCVFLSDGMNSNSVAATVVVRRSSNGREAANKRRAFISTLQVQECLTELSKPYSGLKTGELSFTVFLECLTVVSSFWAPNPLIPLPRKLAAFLADYVEQLNICHANSTLILGTPPYVPLQGGPKVDLTLKSNAPM